MEFETDHHDQTFVEENSTAHLTTLTPQAGEVGIEPTPTGLEAVTLPLRHSPLRCVPPGNFEIPTRALKVRCSSSELQGLLALGLIDSQPVALSESLTLLIYAGEARFSSARRAGHSYVARQMRWWCDRVHAALLRFIAYAEKESNLRPGD